MIFVIVLDCQHQCNQLCEKARLQNVLLYIKSDINSVHVNSFI